MTNNKIFIPYEQARLAEMCQFDENSLAYYYRTSYPTADEEPRVLACDLNRSNLMDGTFLAPTYEQILEWIRTKCNMHISTDYTKNGWTWKWTDLYKHKVKYPQVTKHFETEKEAKDSAILETLTLLEL
jgi:hypothetical protein